MDLRTPQARQSPPDEGPSRPRGPRRRVAFVENLAAGREPWWLRYAPPDLAPDIVGVEESRVARGLGRALARYRLLRGYDVVVTQQDGVSTFLFALLGRLDRRRRFRHVVNEFITAERREGAWSRWKYRFLRFALPAVERFVCSCRGEIRYYAREIGLPVQRFSFVPLATTPRYLGYGAPAEPGLVVGAGRTGRDYDALVRAATGTDLRVIVVAGSAAALPADLPPNVTLQTNIPKDDLDALIQRAQTVVLPLRDQPISIGQSVLVHAMARGKPVVATRLHATVDYVEDGLTGLLVPPGDPAALRRALLQLTADPDRARAMGAAALEVARRELVMPRRLERLSRLLDDVAHGDGMP